MNDCCVTFHIWIKGILSKVDLDTITLLWQIIIFYQVTYNSVKINSIKPKVQYLETDGQALPFILNFFCVFNYRQRPFYFLTFFWAPIHLIRPNNNKNKESHIICKQSRCTMFFLGRNKKELIKALRYLQEIYCSFVSEFINIILLLFIFWGSVFYNILPTYFRFVFSVCCKNWVCHYNKICQNFTNRCT